ncbi:MAG TPA: aminoacyl-tRNA hydrolase, partial [Polyangiaceae bacterium]|nr:aminoacyl-tRNA hydrolase [Polyangiaceae bacterium]
AGRGCCGSRGRQGCCGSRRGEGRRQAEQVILVVGLGNPGKAYAHTRHNFGFEVVDRVVSRAGGGAYRDKFSGAFTEVVVQGERVAALKPQTFMNDSGRSVLAASSFYKLDAKDVLVVHDELDLPFGDIRFKKGGGEAGHNGVRSVSQHLGTKDFVRLRLGVGKPPSGFRGTGADFVLEGFASAERAVLGDLVEQAADAVELFVGRGLEHSMNVTNRRRTD